MTNELNDVTGASPIKTGTIKGTSNAGEAFTKLLQASGIPKGQISTELISQLCSLTVDKISDHNIRKILFDLKINQVPDTLTIQQYLRETLPQTQNITEAQTPGDPTIVASATASRLIASTKVKIADPERWLNEKIIPIHMKWHLGRQKTQPVLKGQEVIDLVRREIIDTGIDPDFKIEDILNPQDIIEAYQLADLTHRINEKVLIPNDVIFVSSTDTGQHSLCKVLDKREIQTNAEITVPLYIYEHQKVLGGNFMTAFMNYIAVSTMSDDLADHYRNLANSSKIPDDAFNKLAQKVYRAIFADNLESEYFPRSVFRNAHLEEEKAHSDAFRFVASILGRRANRMRPGDNVKLAEYLLKNNSTDKDSIAIHTFLKSLSGKPQEQNKAALAIFEAEAKLNGMMFANHPSILLLPLLRSQKVESYDHASTMLTTILSKKLLGKAEKGTSGLYSFIDSELRKGINVLEDTLRTAAREVYPADFLDFSARDQINPGWRSFGLL